MDDTAMTLARMVTQTPVFLALGVGMLVSLGHLVLGRATLPAVLLLVGFAGMAGTQTVWILLDVGFQVELIPYTFYESWASTAFDVVMIAIDAVFLTTALSSVFVGRLGVKP